MMKGCCMLTSCFKKKPLLDDQYGDIQEGHIKYLENEVRFKNEINDLTNMVEQSKVIIKDYEIELDELRYKLANIPPRTITEEITKCKRVSNCQHDTCDFGPMVKTIKQVRADCQSYSEQYSSIIDEHFPKIKKRDDQIQKLKHVLNGRNKEIEEKDQVIFNLNNQIQANFGNITNLNNHINWYNENYQRLLDENEFIKADNESLMRSHTFHKNQSTKLRTQLASVPEDRVSASTESTFQQQFDTYSQ